jgi:hypothetical protein
VIRIQLVGDDRLIARLQALVRRCRSLACELQRRLPPGTLSGRVLRVRTGILRSRENTRIEEMPASAAMTVDANVRCTRPHNTAFAAPIRMNLPERQFHRSVLADMREAIIMELREAVLEGTS